MIRVGKCKVPPQSLLTTKGYDGEDVKRQLVADQHGKCYICERSCVTDFEIEHNKSQKGCPELIQEWTNLFFACRYCNGKKLDHFDDLLNPLAVDIEDEIKQELNFRDNKACFTPIHRTPEHEATIKLLDRVFNGNGKVRKTKEERFFEYTLSVMNRFLSLVNAFLAERTETSEKAVRDELKIDREYLGFKYWIVKSNPVLTEIFVEDVVWNK